MLLQGEENSVSESDYENYLHNEVFGSKWMQEHIFLLLPLTVQVNKNVKSASESQTRL